jgi:hypothetical protein
MCPISVYPTSLNITLMNLKTQIDPNTVIVTDFNTPLSPIDRSSSQNKSTKKF